MLDGDREFVSLRPIATPLPLAFAGLVIASVVISGYELGWIPKAQHHTTGWVLLAVPIPLQLLAAWWGFAARSSAAATGSAVLAAAWTAFALDLITTAPGPPGPSDALGLLLLAAAATLLTPVVAELRVGAFLQSAVLAVAALRFFFTGVSGLTHTHAWTEISGWTGCAVAVAALYAALALELEGTAQEALLPTFRRRLAKLALEAPLEKQTVRVAQEAGVRRQL